MSSSSASAQKSFGRKVSMLVLGALVACVGAFAFAAPAKADPFTMELDHGQINLGFAFKGAEILPAPDNIGGTPLPDLHTAPIGSAVNPPNAKIIGDNTGGNITVDQENFQFPIMIVPNPLDQSPVPITLAATGDLTGTTTADGSVTLAGPIEARVLVLLGDSDPVSSCALPLSGLTLSTDQNEDFAGTLFASGLEGNGALTGAFSITADSTPTGAAVPADCTTVNQVSKGSGSLWVSSGVPTPEQPKQCGPDETGTWPDCVPNPCPTGTTGTPPNCVPDTPKAPKFTAISVTPKKKTVKAGKKVKLTVKATNKGTAAGTITIKIKSSNKKVKVPKSVKIKVAAGKSASKKITVNVTKKAKGKANITAKGAGKTGKSTLTIKKAKK